MTSPAGSLISCLPQQAPGCRGNGINFEQGQAVACGTAFGCAEVVAAIEAGHTGQIQANNLGL